MIFENKEEIKLTLETDYIFIVENNNYSIIRFDSLLSKI